VTSLSVHYKKMITTVTHYFPTIYVIIVSYELSSHLLVYQSMFVDSEELLQCGLDWKNYLFNGFLCGYFLDIQKFIYLFTLMFAIKFLSTSRYFEKFACYWIYFLLYYVYF